MKYLIDLENLIKEKKIKIKIAMNGDFYCIEVSFLLRNYRRKFGVNAYDESKITLSSTSLELALAHLFGFFQANPTFHLDFKLEKI